MWFILQSKALPVLTATVSKVSKIFILETLRAKLGKTYNIHAQFILQTHNIKQ